MSAFESLLIRRSRVQDTHDLFATLVVSLNLTSNTRFFRSYHNTFTTDDAAANLSSLRFSQSNRSSDPNDPQRIITTTTTTTFTMTREIAKGICQQFMDARLIENATDPTSTTFKDRGIYSITPKGLHVLERFITKNGIAADHLVRVFQTQPICMRLLHLERRSTDDEIIVTRPVLEVVFKRFVGSRNANYVIDPMEAQRAFNAGQVRAYQENVRPPHNFERGAGAEMQDVVEKNRLGQLAITKMVFSSAGAIDWLCDHSTCCCRDEAAEVLAHFVRYGFITLHFDRARADGGHSSSVGSKSSGQAAEAEFRWGPKVTYRVTEEGRRLANWDGLSATPSNGSKAVLDGKKSSHDDDRDSADQKSIFGQPSHGGLVSESRFGANAGNGLSSLAGQPNSNGILNAGMGTQTANPIGGEWSLAGGIGVGNILDSQLLGKMSMKELFDVDLSSDANWSKEGQHSSTTRLRAILEDIRLRALFRDYLRNNYCEENLGFWLDVQDFRRRFSTTSSAMGGGYGSIPGSTGVGGAGQAGSSGDKSSSGAGGKRGPLLRGMTSFLSGGTGAANASNAMESHQNDLNVAAVSIYRTYLAPQSPNELNIDHNLRADVVNFIQKCADEAGVSLHSINNQPIGAMGQSMGMGMGKTRPSSSCALAY